MFVFDSTVEPQHRRTFAVGFGDGVRHIAEYGDVAPDERDNEASQWTFEEAYRAGYDAGAAWAKGR